MIINTFRGCGCIPNCTMADLRSRLHSALGSLELEGVEETGNELGRGAYGVVVEVKLHGLLCAGKKLHEALLQDSRRQAQEDAVMTFVDECLLHSRQRHPRIVQLIGVHFKPRSSIPTLVMEYLPMSLTQCLEQYPHVPERVKHEILLDVAHGLEYLHCKKPPIWHRDLTANNVLLTSDMRAKITDLGMSRAIDRFRPVGTHLTKTPGNMTVIPPEALRENPSYDHTIDVFSFGCLMIHVLIQEWPVPLDAYIEDIKGKPRKRTELERRQHYVSKIEVSNSLLPHIKQCLLEPSGKRPDMSSLCMVLRHILSQHPQTSHNRLDLLCDIDAKSNQVLSLTREKETLSNEKAALVVKKEDNESCIQNLTKTLANTNSEKICLENQNHQLVVANAAYKRMAAQNQRMCEARLTENRGLHAQVEMKKAELASLQDQITPLCSESKSKQDEINTLQQQITSLRSQREVQQEEITSVHAQNEAIQTQLEAFQKQLNAKELELDSLQKLLASLCAQNVQQQEEAFATQEQVALLHIQNDMKQEQLDALRVEKDCLQRQNTHLEEENKSLIQQLAMVEAKPLSPGIQSTGMY